MKDTSVLISLTFVLGFVFAASFGCASVAEPEPVRSTLAAGAEENVVSANENVVSPSSEQGEDSGITGTEGTPSPTTIPATNEPEPSTGASQARSPTSTTTFDPAIEIFETSPDFRNPTGPSLALLFLNDHGTSLLITDFNSREQQQVRLRGTPVDLSWLSTSCDLAIPVFLEDQFWVVILSMNHSHADYILSLEAVYSDVESGFLAQPSLNSRGDVLALIEHTGEHGYAFSQFQNLELWQMDETSKFTKLNDLTTNDGVLGFAWSPDGTKIAYSDFDAQNIRQLHVYDLQTQRTQVLTFFDDPGSLVGEPEGNTISQFTWTADGSTVAFVAGTSQTDGSVESSLWVASLQEGTSTQLREPEKTLYSIMGWSENGQIVAVYSQEDKDEVDLSLIDLKSAEDIEVLPGGIIENEIRLVAALRGTSEWLGENQDGTLFYVDLREPSTEILENIWLPASGLILSSTGRVPGEIVAGGVKAWAMLSVCEDEPD